MTPEELNDLAHEIAEEDSKVTIECATLTVTRNGAGWYDLESADGDPGAEGLDRAVRYLEAAGILHRCADARHLVGWDEDGVTDAA